MLTWLTGTIGSRPLGLARVIIGGAALIRSLVAWRALDKLTNPEILRTPYAEWTPEPTTPLVVLIVTVWVVSAILFMIGWRVSWTGALLLIAILATLALDQQAYSNHLYLMAWLVFLLIIADAGAGLNLSRVDRPVVRWGALLLMIQMSVVYGFSALTKLNDDFLSGEILARVIRGGLVRFPEALRTPRLLSLLAGIVIIVELSIVLLMWRTRFRPAAILLGLGLHTAITLLMASTLELLVFSLEMLALYPLFLTQEVLIVIWDDDCGSCRGWVRRFRRFDVLRTLDVVGKSDPRNQVPAEDVERSLHLIHLSEVTNGFKAVAGILEHLVPTIWVAPISRLPGISHLGERWYRWQARRRSCLVGGEASVTAPGSP